VRGKGREGRGKGQESSPDWAWRRASESEIGKGETLGTQLRKKTQSP
jgi:hypothetical protein